MRHAFLTEPEARAFCDANKLPISAIESVGVVFIVEFDGTPASDESAPKTVRKPRAQAADDGTLKVKTTVRNVGKNSFKHKMPD